jgi:hypothetical protein
LIYILLSLTSPDNYKRSSVIFGQISFFAVLCYVFFTPVYIFLGLQAYENLMYIFLVHTIIATF